MKLISFREIEDLGISPEMCCEWVEEALRIKHAVDLPKKISLKPKGMANVFYNTMPCLVPQISRGGVKLVTRYPERRPALDSELLLYDLTSGECLALMDADWITTMRTGAVAAHSVKLLAKSGFSKVAFAGLGNTARATLLCLRELLPDLNLEVGLLRYKDQHEGFERRFRDMPGVVFREFDGADALAQWCEVFISCVTAADSEICSPECFKPGALVVPVHTRGFAQCDLAFDKVFCDDEGHVSGFGYYEKFKPKLAEVADVVCGRHPGRENDGERILAYNIGISLHDIYFAANIEEMVKQHGSAETLTMAKPSEKFWV